MDVRPPAAHTDAHPADRRCPVPVMQILHDHLPLTLLVDLSLGEQVRSDEVFAGEPGDLEWLVPPPR